MNCRFCQTELQHVFIDLVNSPPSNSFLTAQQLNEPEIFYPLKVFICHKCYLVQIDEYKKSGEIFSSEYVYFSSYSTSWLKHAKDYVDLMTDRFGIGEHSRVVEIASNDGYLLQYFVQKKVPVLGIEPTSNTAEVAISKGVETVIDFFGTALAKELAAKGVKADLLLGNNVLAHVPDILDFVRGLKVLLATNGVITMEFPHLMQLIENNQFDTIYHEHFSYLSLYTVKLIFESQGLVLFDVEELSTHGGSLRIYAGHKEDLSKSVSGRVKKLLDAEIRKGVDSIVYYANFQKRAEKVKLELLEFLIKQKRLGVKVAGYGAAAKGNTLLNYCGVKNDLVEFVVDMNPHKQNKYMPASHIRVVDEERLKMEKPGYVIVFPWNLQTEIAHQLTYIRQWGGKLIVPIPELQEIV